MTIDSNSDTIYPYSEGTDIGSGPNNYGVIMDYDVYEYDEYYWDSIPYDDVYDTAEEIGLKDWDE